MKKIRIYVKIVSIVENTIVEVESNDFNYLTKVMRKKVGDEISIFNGKNGQWLAKIIQISKKSCQIQAITQEKQQYNPPKITLAFAPVKNVRIDFIAAKATELGITKFQPIITHHSIVDKINLERFNANIKEAAEQCERLDLPEILSPVKLDSFLKKLGQDKILILCDESGSGKKANKILSKINLIQKENLHEIIIFIGPEGGFSSQEFERFNQLSNLNKISLGPRILRADTAIISATTLVQEFLGDFDLKPNF
jgi:16S rRNA (uracil1498-N3)-methyltransferase